MNPNCKSVESELEKALFIGGCFQEANYGRLQKLQWTRAARTDRGVHALGQCCSMRLHFPTDPMERQNAIARINLALPSDIRLHAVTKVTRAFNSHINCSSRRYKYLLPTYLFMPVNEINALLQQTYEKQGPIVDCAKSGGFAEPGSKKFLSHQSLQSIHQKLSSYRCSKEQLDLFSKAMSFYQGTRSYHNFTTGKDSEDDSSKRFITECICSDPFIGHMDSGDDVTATSSVGITCSSDIGSSNSFNNQYGSTVSAVESTTNVEYVCVTINGQSFVLNQIRKMIGLAVDVARGSTTMDVMHSAVDPKIKVSYIKLCILLLLLIIVVIVTVLSLTITVVYIVCMYILILVDFLFFY